MLVLNSLARRVLEQTDDTVRLMCATEARHYLYVNNFDSIDIVKEQPQSLYIVIVLFGQWVGDNRLRTGASYHYHNHH